jgi:hypothetical protein
VNQKSVGVYILHSDTATDNRLRLIREDKNQTYAKGTRHTVDILVWKGREGIT